jgi:uncharacterized membrane protein (GlpM family)
MKILNGVISVLLGVLSLYLMFLTPQTDQDIILGFMVLLVSIIFMCFMIIGEQKDEIEELRNTLFKINDIMD